MRLPNPDRDHWQVLGEARDEYPTRDVNWTHRSIDRSGNSRGGGCSLIVTSSSFESDRLGSAAIEKLKEYPWITDSFHI